MENRKLITIRQIQKISECSDMPREFVHYLKKKGFVSGVQVPYGKRLVWKYSSMEAGFIQSVWYFRKKRFELDQCIEYARMCQDRRNLKNFEPDLFSKLAAG